MPRWNEYKDGLQEVCNLLRRPFSRTRLLQTCGGQDAEELQHTLQSFTSSVYKGRWGSVADATAAVGRAERLLRRVWDVKSYAPGQSYIEVVDDDLPEEKKRLNLQKLDERLLHLTSGGPTGAW